MKKIDIEILNKYYDDGMLIKQTHPSLPLIIWNYSKICQFEKNWNEILLQCRGLVTDIDGNIVARPMKKFFNKEELETEGYMDTANIGTIPTDLPFEVFEKMDGSLGLLFNYKGDWIFASRGSFESDQAIKGGEIMLTIEDSYKFLTKDSTYIFEIIYKENRVVLDYGDMEDLVLLGVINTETGAEMSHEDMMYNHDEFTIVKKYDETVFDDISKLKEVEEDNKEGFVIRFSNGFRMKVKFDEYCRLHRIVTNVSNKTIWESLKNDEGLDEVLDRVPDEFYNWVRRTEKELKDSFKEIENACYREYYNIARNLNVFDSLTNKEDNNEYVVEHKKQFALKAKEFKYSGILFSLYNGKSYDLAIWKMIKPEWSTPFRDGFEDEEL